MPLVSERDLRVAWREAEVDAVRLPTAEVRVGDALALLREMPEASVQCVVTSPPYWGLRDYGVPGQLGLEARPQEYVARMVEVFEEVRRVLRADGTLWLNMGDCYAAQRGGTMMPAETLAGGTGGFGDRNAHRGRAQDARQAHRDAKSYGLKHKDLVGMPWRLAFALQQPRYVGRIKDERERIWLAAMVEAEGCMFIHRRPAGQKAYSTYERKDGTRADYVRTQDTYGVGLEVSSTDLPIVERCLAIAGLGSICSQTPRQNARRNQTIYRWNLRTNECRGVIQELYPHFVAKQHEARLVIGCPSSGESAEAAWAALKAIHQGRATPDIDFPAPESMFERGWFLRSDVIWAKLSPNPMPESVTDRPTKAHEYLFLLTKSARYYYDADAIREPSQSGPSDVRKMLESRERIGGKHVASDDPMLAASSRTNVGRKRAVGGAPLNGRAGVSAEGYDERKWDDRSDGMSRPPMTMFDREYNPLGRNARTVWTIATQPFAEAHFATFPPELPRRCILAGTRPGDLVLDPFAGAGTTLLVAHRLGRSSLGLELNPKYAEMARRRIRDDAPLLAGKAEGEA